MLFTKRRCLSATCLRKFVSTQPNTTDVNDVISFDENTFDIIEKNITLRRHSNNLSLIKNLIQDFRSTKDPTVKSLLETEILKLPNKTHPRIVNYGADPKVVMKNIVETQFKNTLPFSEIAKYLNLYRMDHLGNYTGHKSYYLMGSLAMLEQALTKYALDYLQKQGFKYISVPDILPRDVIVGCGMQTDGDRTQVYKIDSSKCLSGTSEMALAGYFNNAELNVSNLPLKTCSVSRCYRAETSSLQEEKGIYRVHQFNKVEMFALCTESQSEKVLELFKDIEINLYRDLNINFKLLDMPPFELGSPAYQKYDIEAWMPGRHTWGEISSCSNCTDYQATRLNIIYKNESNNSSFIHTVNGTAVAIPRLLIALIESNIIRNDVVRIPDCLQPYLKMETIQREKRVPELKLNKSLKCD